MRRATEASVNAERAYIAVINFGIEGGMSPTTPQPFTINLINAGKTFAFDASGTMEYSVVKMHPNMPIPSYRSCPVSNLEYFGMAVKPGAALNYHLRVFDGMKNSDRDAIIKGTDVIEFHACFRYGDVVSNRRRITEFNGAVGVQGAVGFTQNTRME